MEPPPFNISVKSRSNTILILLPLDKIPEPPSVHN